MTPDNNGATQDSLCRHRGLCPGRAMSWSRVPGPAMHVLVATLSIVAVATSGCANLSMLPASDRSPRVVTVVAAENFWGSIARQVGGVHAEVSSLIANPNVDPHAYEPTASDARAVAQAQLVVENGVGYDTWMSQLVAADGPGVKVLDVASVTGAGPGANPHRWYDPGNVVEVVHALARELGSADPTDRAYFEQQAHRFLTVALAHFDRLVEQIRSRFSGTRVGASESIFSMLAPSLGLEVLTPSALLRAVSEGGEITSSDLNTATAQITRHEIRVFVFNRQNATPAVEGLLGSCRSAGVPIVSITETLVPATDSFQQWQTSQLEALLSALTQATR